MLTLDKIYHAAYVLAPVIRKTDLIAAPLMNAESNIFLKTENLQITGSFKVRGAYYKISQLSQEERDRGVIACSAGNHAQGVALAAAKNKLSSLICIPEGAPISKVEATKSYGAEVCLVKGAYDDAYRRACKIQKESGRVFIHPFNDVDVIAGQGTIGLEILNQLPDVDAVLVPVGGGGLISGLAFAIKSLNPNCKVYGVQAAGAPSMKEALKNKKVAAISEADTFADGIAVKCPGELTYELCSRYVDDIVTVTDDETAAAVLSLIEHQKLIAEGAGAVAVAAAMFNKVPVKGKKVVCVLSGGNIDVTILSRVISRGLLMEGRLGEVTLELSDKPGQLQRVAEIIAAHGANVVNVYHDRGGEGTKITGCYLCVGMETRNHAHVQEITEALGEAGFRIINE